MAVNLAGYSHFLSPVELRGVEPRSKRGSNTLSTCLSKTWFSNEDWIKATDLHLISCYSPAFRSIWPTISDTTAPPDRAASDQQHPGDVPLRHLMPDLHNLLYSITRQEQNYFRQLIVWALRFTGQQPKARHAYVPLLPAVKTGQPQIVTTAKLVIFRFKSIRKSIYYSDVNVF
jgi:hypothetical protein